MFGTSTRKMQNCPVQVNSLATSRCGKTRLGFRFDDAVIIRKVTSSSRTYCFERDDSSQPKPLMQKHETQMVKREPSPVRISTFRAC